MPNTVPNQRLIAIHRERAASDFLGIKNSHWQAAARDLGAHALMLYLYFASNANGYMLALSPAAIRQAVGMPQSTYRDQFTKLIDRGYLIDSRLFVDHHSIWFISGSFSLSKSTTWVSGIFISSTRISTWLNSSILLRRPVVVIY